MIHMVREPANREQRAGMLETLKTYTKLAVDVRRGVLAGGGAMHADCEAALLEDGSRQEDVWGADWVPATRTVTFESVINLRPPHNRSIDITDSKTREQVASIVRRLLDVP